MPALGVVFFLLVCVVQLQCDGFYLIIFYFVINKIKIEKIHYQTHTRILLSQAEPCASAS